MADHPTRDDIDLIDGGFYGDDPAAELHVDARATRPSTSTRRTTSGGSRHTPRCSAHRKDPSTFSNAGGIRPDNGPAPDDDRHGRPRPPGSGASSSTRASRPAGCATASRDPRTACDAIIDAVCERGECDFVRDVAAPLPMIMIGDTLGVAPEDRDDLLRWSDDMRAGSQSGSATEEQFMAAMNAFDGVHRRSARTRSRERRARTRPTTS